MHESIESRCVGSRKFRVLLAEESPTVRQSLRQELEGANWIEIVAETNKSQEAITLFFQLRPDALVVSTCIEGQGGFEVIRCIRRAFANCAAILTSRQPDSFVTETGRLLGAAAVCCVAERPTQLVKQLRRLAEQNRHSMVPAVETADKH
jgi:DNA-binding NarL/FixJ family response regulator